MTTMADPRESLRQKLSEVIGDRHADTLMRALPVLEGVDLATRSDIDRLGTEIDRLSTDMSGVKTDIDGIKADLGRMKTDLVTVKAEVGEVGRRVDRIEDKMDRGFFQLGAEMRGHSRLFVVTQLGSVITLGGLLVAFMALS